MNTMKRITNEQALNIALAFAGIDNDENCCLSNRYQNGFFRIAVWTPYLKYEFYVDAADGEVAGIDTVPVPYPEALSFSTSSEDGSPIAA